MIDEERIKELSKEFFAASRPTASEDVAAPQAVDIYQLAYNNRFNESKRQRPNGASPKMKIDADVAISGLSPSEGLRAAFGAAKDTYARLMAKGDVARAKMAQEQYMQDRFLPAIDAIVHANTADELANADNVLDELDKYVLTPGGSTKGYTRAYVQKLYGEEMGKTEPISDGFVRREVDDISELAAEGQIRAAVGKATKLQKMIDAGEHSASDDDYALIQKVALRGV